MISSNAMRYWLAVGAVLLLGPLDVGALGTLYSDSDDPRPLAVTAVAVDIRIQDRLALTRLDQEFTNDTGTPTDAFYEWVLPDDAVLTELAVWIDGQRIAANIQEKTDEPATASGAEHPDERLLKLSIADIPAGQHRRVEVEYMQILAAENGVMRYRLPLISGSAPAAPIENFRLNAAVSNRGDVDIAVTQAFRTSARIAASAEGTKQLAVEEAQLFPQQDFELRIDETASSPQPVVLSWMPPYYEEWGYYALWVPLPDDLGFEANELSIEGLEVDDTYPAAGSQIRVGDELFQTGRYRVGGRFDLKVRGQGQERSLDFAAPLELAVREDLPVLLDEDFEDGEAQGWQLGPREGNWIIEEGLYHPDRDHRFSWVVYSVNSSSYTLEIRMRIGALSDQTKLILQEADKGEESRIDFLGTRSLRLINPGGGQWHLPFPEVREGWLDIRIEIGEGLISTYINGKGFPRVPSGSTPPDGSIGIGAISNSGEGETIALDYVRILQGVRTTPIDVLVSRLWAQNKITALESRISLDNEGSTNELLDEILSLGVDYRLVTLKTSPVSTNYRVQILSDAKRRVISQPWLEKTFDLQDETWVDRDFVPRSMLIEQYTPGIDLPAELDDYLSLNQHLIVVAGNRAFELDPAPPCAEPGPFHPAEDHFTRFTPCAQEGFGRSVIDGQWAFVGGGDLNIFKEENGVWSRYQTFRHALFEAAANVAVEGEWAASYFSQGPAPPGPIFLFKKMDDRWALQDTLPIPNNFGIHLDGNRLLAGSTLYRRDGDAWTQETQFTLRDPQFNALEIRDADIDGEWVAISAGTAVYLFKNNGGKWTQAAEVRGDDPNGFFGSALALDDGWLLVGDNKGVGSFYAFEKAGDRWIKRAHFPHPVPPSRSYGFFGSALALDGEWALVSGYGNTPFPNLVPMPATVYLYRRQRGQWLPQTALLPDPSLKSTRYGSTLSLNDHYAITGGTGTIYLAPLDALALPSEPAPTSSLGTRGAFFGEWALGGAPDDSEKGPQAGAVYLYRNEDRRWTNIQKLTAPDAQAGDQFGYATALGGQWALVGAPGKNTEGTAYFYRIQDGQWEAPEKIEPVTEVPRERFGASMALDGEKAFIGAPGSSTSSGAVYLYQRETTAWTQRAEILPTDSQPGDQFGAAVRFPARGCWSAHLGPLRPTFSF